jgi:hypothetical protein
MEELQKQTDLVHSDISYLKLDDSIKRNKLNAMQEILDKDKACIAKQEAEVNRRSLASC